jgi:hypothetical protein
MSGSGVEMSAAGSHDWTYNHPRTGSAGSTAADMSDRDRHNMIAITDVLDEVSRKAAIDSEIVVRKVRMKG